MIKLNSKAKHETQIAQTVMDFAKFGNPYTITLYFEEINIL